MLHSSSMNRHIIYILLLATSLCSHAQTESQNFVLSRTFKQTGAPVNDIRKVSIQVQYLDGLGRPSQTVSVGQSATGTDLIIPIEYDPYGRQTKNYLPYAGGSNGAFQDDATSSVASWYLSNSAGLQATPTPNDNLTRPFQETVFEASPTNRVLNIQAPGTRSRSSNFSYTANSGSEVKLYKYAANADIFKTISSGSNYAAGTLYRKQSLDDQNYESIEYTDMKGRLICKKVIASGNETLATYYVYDDFGLLRAVLQPHYQQDPSASNYAFLYDYDEYGRVITKYVPGGGKTDLVYDIFDRQVMSQDANQLARGVWGFTKYDAFNRPVMSGEITSASSRSTQQSAFNASLAHHEDKSGAGIGYTLGNTLPAIAEDNVLKVFHFDDYGFPGNQAYVNVLSVTNNSAVKGQLTGSRSRMLNAGNQWLISTTHYDTEYRPIQTVRQLYDLGANAVERISTKYRYDIAAVVDQEKTEHLLTGVVTNSVLKKFEYDHADRLLSIKEQVMVGNKTKEAYTIAQRYNILGQLKSKYQHGYATAPTKFRRRTDYEHNIRGWVTEGKTFYNNSNADAPFYGFALTYANVLNNSQYSSGNISSMVWSGKDENTMSKGLSFTYDAASRLKSSAGLGGYGDIENGINYDLNGNIRNLARAGSAVDNLTYSYNGNRLSSVNDASGSAKGMKTGDSAYGYDANGNVISDGNNGAVLTYNYLNLPKTVTIGTKAFAYDYDAAGTKHKYAGDTLTLKYAGPFEYNAANTFKRLSTSEGQAVMAKGDTIEFDYYVKDHLGNVRVVFDESGKVLQKTDYYPFGLEIDRNTPATSQAARYNANRFLYNGKELQVGTGFVDYGARMYMPELGRWGTVDKMANKYSDNSSYNYVLNRPIIAIDPDGNQIIFVVRGKDDKSYRTLTYRGGSAYWNDTGKKYDGRGANNTIFRILKAYQKIEQSEDKILKAQLHRLETSELDHFVSQGSNGSKVSPEGLRDPSTGREGTTTEYDFSKTSRKSNKEMQGIEQSDLADLAHELSHQFDHETGNTKDNMKENTAKDPSEVRAVKNENRARDLEGLPKRTTYGTEKIDPQKLKD
jgi:RHS repeat-associated protein